MKDLIKNKAKQLLIHVLDNIECYKYDVQYNSQINIKFNDTDSIRISAIHALANNEIISFEVSDKNRIYLESNKDFTEVESVLAKDKFIKIVDNYILKSLDKYIYLSDKPTSEEF